MLTVTRKTDYALIALATLARAMPNRLSAREIAMQFHMPLPLLMNILTELRQRGLVVSTRGVKGGYQLARAAETITLADLLDATEGPVRLALCCGPDSHAAPRELDCDLEHWCPVKEPVRKVHGMFRRFLGQVTLAHLIADELPIGVGLDVSLAQRTSRQPAGAVG